MYAVSANVISIRKYRWSKRVNLMKKIALDPVMIATMAMILLSGVSYHLLSTMDPQYVEYLMYIN